MSNQRFAVAAFLCGVNITDVFSFKLCSRALKVRSVLSRVRLPRCAGQRRRPHLKAVTAATRELEAGQAAGKGRSRGL